ncbi:SDR family oxidoreductase [Chitinophaga lutea]|uniref:SDR family oxidoreductase n=1 Tax=Chitinophaga lutea TaxID=2488634 RepID=A0A3N4PMA2_9BACT|nr:SDR family oxidoreductase [Chitinophaga lutea]RPE08708.1 SDR family oxidoreductase [Chitinophaga lutea]
MSNLTGKIAVITGGNSGIGYSSARALKEQGATVIITGRRKDAVEKAALELGVSGLVADQASLPGIDALVDGISRQFGKVDILMVNAGISRFAPIESMEETMFDSIMNVNLKGAFFTLGRFIPILNDHASVIMLSSTSASTFTPGISVYSASKAAVNAIVKVAALELAPRKIRVNAVSPGPVATEIMGKSGLEEQGMQDRILSGIPLSRFGAPEEVAKLVVYLSGPDAAFITGAEFMIDGGQSI